MRIALLCLVLAGAPELKPAGSPRPELADALRAGVRAARPALERCFAADGGTACLCTALKNVRFDVALDGGTLTVTYPLQAHTGPSFTLDGTGRVIECHAESGQTSTR